MSLPVHFRIGAALVPYAAQELQKSLAILLQRHLADSHNVKQFIGGGG
jgi:hypothetical protein